MTRKIELGKVSRESESWPAIFAGEGTDEVLMEFWEANEEEVELLERLVAAYNYCVENGVEL